MKSLFLIPYMSLWPTESNEDATFSSPVAVSPVQSRGLATGTLRSLSGRLRICNFHVYIELYRYIISMYIYIDIGFRCSTCSFIYIYVSIYTYDYFLIRKWICFWQEHQHFVSRTLFVQISNWPQKQWLPASYVGLRLNDMFLNRSLHETDQLTLRQTVHGNLPSKMFRFKK
jgi:hypothetical protein